VLRSDAPSIQTADFQRAQLVALYVEQVSLVVARFSEPILAPFQESGGFPSLETRRPVE
jgi:hypothetical protein